MPNCFEWLIQKLFDGQLNRTEKNQSKVFDAVKNSERQVRVERLVTYCYELMTKAFTKNEKLFELAKKTRHQHLPTWRIDYMRQLLIMTKF